ncbi:MAG: hypothetical protein FJ276_01915 [Planctomycetes bacterium]|nr:hypothetical protein [Planctomycetota bacterium]
MNAEVYGSLEAVFRQPRLVGYYRVLQRAWSELGLSSVLCVNQVPTLYRVDSNKVVDEYTLADLHRKFWNQGVASVLLVVDPKTAYLFSGLQRPVRRGEQEISDPACAGSPLVGKFDLAAFSQQEQAFTESLRTGEFYRVYSTKFKPAFAVDQSLTANLMGLRRCLARPGLPALPDHIAHDFICRLLFVCYLVDRGIVPLEGHPPGARVHEALAAYADATQARDFLYDLFRKLQYQFNGSMFDADLDAEKAYFSAEWMDAVRDFLRGDAPNTRQPTFGFWAYDFKFIPIETISGIYESFLPGHSKGNLGAYYTPRFLAEFAIDVAVDGKDDWHKLSYLDPSCGSGVFLVTLFNRLATWWELAHRELEGDPRYNEMKDTALRDILRNQICGIDINPQAGTLACFSLYVALLDSFSPTTIREYIAKSKFRKLPKLMERPQARTDDKNYLPVIYTRDTLAPRTGEEDAFKNRFDVVIGNPPWGGPMRSSGDIALRFLGGVKPFVRPGGSACLLLPSRLFLNVSSNAFQERWIAENTLRRVVQLADFRRILFSEALCPCMVVTFSPAPCTDPAHTFLYDAPKFDTASRRQGLVLISETDRKSVPQAKLSRLAAQGTAPTAWKRLFWGTPRDQRFLEYLDTFPRLRERFADRNTGWLKGQGFVPDVRDRRAALPRRWWNNSHLFLDARSRRFGTDNILFDQDCEPVGSQFEVLYRSPDKSLFLPPAILFNQGFTRFVYADFPVLFRHAIQAIHAPAGEEDLLLFLLALLQSDLALYCCFHNSSMLGIERDVVRFEEVLDLPFPLPADAPSKRAEQIVRKVADLLREEKATLLRRKQDLDDSAWQAVRAKRALKLKPILDEQVCNYFDLTDSARWLIADTVHVFKPSSTPTAADRTDLPTLLPVHQAGSVPDYANGLQAYADALTSTLNGWAEEQQSSWRVAATGGVDAASGLALVSLTLAREAKPYREAPLTGAVWRRLFDAFAEQKVIERRERRVFGFDGDTFHVLRPIPLAHWTRTAAANDADELFALLQSMRRGHG